MSAPDPPSTRHRSEKGSALIMTLLVAMLAMTLGLGLALLGETEALQSKAFLERQRSRAAARDAVELAAAWFTAPPDRVPMLPPPGEWITDLRRGDLDGDGRADAACDGSREDGAWDLFPVVDADAPAAGRLAAAVTSACGTATHPDLVLTLGGSPYLKAIAATLGDDVVIERISVHAAPRHAGLDGHERRVALEVTATVALRRGPLLVARNTATGHVRLLPSLATDDVISAGVDVSVAAGSAVRWGRVACDGDIDLPPLEDETFPYSGLPRQADGSPMSFAPGSPVDWSLLTPQRECVLTELMGRTARGSWQLSQDMKTPALPDPWISFAAGGVVRAGGEPLGAATQRQPRPYDARFTDLGTDLSHVSAAWTLRQRSDALGRAAGVQELALALSRAGSGVRRFVLAPDVATTGEPKWREGGIGPAQTAAEWMRQSDEPMIAAFAAGSAPVPARVTLAAGRGVILVEARTVALAAPTRLTDVAALAVTMPGEPFQDSGIDADGDGEIDPGTAGNGRWDADLDDDGVADEGRPQDWLFDSQVLPATDMPSNDQDPSLLESMPHEAFLNLDYPNPDAAADAVSVRFDAGRATTARPVRDLSGDDAIRAGSDVLTTVARDEEGARRERIVGFAGVLACLGGDIVALEGSSLHGALRATGSVRLEAGSSVTFDAGLQRDGIPTDQALAAGILGDIAWTTGVLVDPLRPVAAGEDAPPSRGEDTPPSRGEDAPPRRDRGADGASPGGGGFSPGQGGGSGPTSGGKRKR